MSWFNFSICSLAELIMRVNQMVDKLIIYCIVFTKLLNIVRHVSRARVIAWDTWRGYKVPQELRLLMEVQHVAGVVKMIDFYEREDSFIYVMEKPPNYLDMFDYITQQKRLTETAARDFFRQVVATVAACSRSKIVHRDIKADM